MTAVDGLIFDLDGTLLDRNAVFVKVAGDFCDEHLDNLTTMTRGEAVDHDGPLGRRRLFQP